MLVREIVLIGSFRGWHNGEKQRLKDLFFYSPQLGLKAAPPPLPHQISVTLSFFPVAFSGRSQGEADLTGTNGRWDKALIVISATGIRGQLNLNRP